MSSSIVRAKDDRRKDKAAGSICARRAVFHNCHNGQAWAASSRRSRRGDTFQRVLTYTFSALIRKIETVLFLGIGLIITGHAVLTPMLKALFLITTDFITMSLTTDKATPSLGPDAWRIAAIGLGLLKLRFSAGVLAAWIGLAWLERCGTANPGARHLGIRNPGNRLRRSRVQAHVALPPRPLARAIHAFGSRFRFRARDSRVLVAPLPSWLIALSLVSSLVFAVAFEIVKVGLFSRLRIS